MMLRISMAALAAALAAPVLAVTPPPPVATSSASARLKALFAEADEASLRRNPLTALFRGDGRYAAQFGDYLSDAYVAAEREAAEGEMRALQAIDRAALSPAEQVSYDVFRYQAEQRLAGFAPELLAATLTRPIDHFNGFQSFYPDVASGQGVAPFKTVENYDDNLKRLDGFVAYLDGARLRMAEGVRTGVVQPRIVSERVLGQLQRAVDGGVEGSPFMGPVKTFPESVPESERARLTAAYRAAVEAKVLPAYSRLRDFMANTYLPASRAEPGLSAMPGGPALYRYRVRTQTTTDMTPEAIHALGLSEVARITAAMEDVKRQVGFKGSLAAFFQFIRTDPRFKLSTGEAFGDGYRAIGKRVDAAMPRLFEMRVKTPLEIRQVPDFLAKDQAAAYYQPGTPDGSRPGVFFYNTDDLPSRTTPGMETLYLHEAVPGHHYQGSLSIENASLPAFQRFGGPTAFFEGWALYAESLGPELGLFRDPYQMYGRLDDEMLRAMRLVVDTGLHAKGWSRDKAIEYMLSNSAMGRTDATNEVDRYIAMPGQALAYKVGQLKISALRAEAQKSLGRRFDVRHFHSRVLEDGALPLDVLDAKIRRWIAAGGGAGRGAGESRSTAASRGATSR